jgi:hypothetical protein
VAPTLVLTTLQIIAVITPYMVGNSPGSANLGPKVFFIWGSFCILSLLFAYFLVPEMKGLTLEQVDKMMEEVTPRNSAAWFPHTTFAEEMRRINAAKAAGAPTRVGDDPKGVSQQYHQQYNELHGQQSFQQIPHTAPPQHYNQNTPPPQQWQQSPPPHHYQHTPPPQHYQHTPPPQSWQQTPPPQQYPQELPQHPFQRQHTY